MGKTLKNSTKKEFNSEPVKAKIKFYNENSNTNFYNKKIPEEGSQFIYLSVVLIDSIFRPGKKYYFQVFIEERRYVAKEKKRCLSILLMT